MLYLGACTGASPPTCVPCVSCDACAQWMLSQKTYGEVAAFTQEFISDGYLSGPVSFSGSSRSTCGTVPYLSEVLTFSGLAVEFDLPGGMTDIHFCGVRPYNYASELSGAHYLACDDAIDLTGVSVSVSGSTVTLSATSVVLPALSYWDGDPPPGDHNSTLVLIFTVTFGGVTRYVQIVVSWSWDGTDSSVAYTVVGECVSSCETTNIPLWSIFYEHANRCDTGWAYTDEVGSQTIAAGVIQEQARPCLLWPTGEEIATETLITEWSDGDWFLRCEVAIWQGSDGVMYHSLTRTVATPYPPSDPCEDNGQGSIDMVSDWSTGSLPRRVRIRTVFDYGPMFVTGLECSLGPCLLSEGEVEVSIRGQRIQAMVYLEWE